MRAAFQRFESEFPAGEHESAFGIIRAVAFEAVLGKQRLHIAGKIDRRGVSGRSQRVE
jgi:hypothetical protein